jgi:hypothetical protein
MAPEKEEEPRRDIIYIKESPGRFHRKGAMIYRSKLLSAALFLPLMLLIACRITQTRRLKFASDIKYAGRIIASRATRLGLKALKRHLKTQDRKAFYEELFKTLQQYLGGKLGVPAAGITYDAVEGTLLSRGLDLEELAKIKRLFEISDQARFASTLPDSLSMKNHLEEIAEVMSYLERMRL